MSTGVQLDDGCTIRVVFRTFFKKVVNNRNPTEVSGYERGFAWIVIDTAFSEDVYWTADSDVSWPRSNARCGEEACY